MRKRKKYIYGIKEVQGLPDGTHLHLSCYEWEGRNDCVKQRDGILIPFEWFDDMFIDGVPEEIYMYKKVAVKPESRRDGMR